MNELTEITRQAPSIAAVIIVVILFIRYLEKRDTILQNFIQLMTKELKALTITVFDHARETTDAIAEMHRRVEQIEHQDQ